ncbi:MULTISPECIES: MarR family transcriptional regulator [Pseudoalteromonas]|uniref:MarR family transcriptional regulator n=1 Tax=Pseudoalteromonas TaxID=53246 RepID=UPI001107AA11|nr:MULTISPECIES: MarR family transcriptional regulator [Pseudoalteromonas]MCF2860766.1 MarR family transcriptional regulator [Pseudoalteromonas sp. CNAT2-18]MCG7556635.1 MarR family transcriptional regulator [Pseudoalteromonas sp. CNAT2-18.1]MCG7565521.1 MarR family transcriptional regulator [Pseudoalteromonas sp. CnMc7-15]TLX51737.1 MarR family transcriptional regulator [Pseudoalteromonas ruthenica]TMO87192.1 MarR family transcriptional regulator [Pseudoalteromonas ruthenica]
MADIPFHETLDLSLCGKLGRVHRICRQAVSVAVEPLGFTQPGWTAMMHMYHLGEGCTQHQLATSLDIEMPSLTRTLKQLEHAQVIERRVDEHDKRCRRLYFTAQGEQQLSALKARISEVKTHLYRGLSDEQLNMMALGLVALEDNANQFMEDQE